LTFPASTGAARWSSRRDDIIDIHWEADYPFQPATEDPEGDDAIGVDSECNGPDYYFSEPVAEDPELPPPPESLDRA
jgi:hypothetical protein